MTDARLTDAERLQIRLLASIADGIRLLTTAPSNPAQWQSGARDLYDREACELLSHVAELLERD